MYSVRTMSGLKCVSDVILKKTYKKGSKEAGIYLSCFMLNRGRGGKGVHKKVQTECVCFSVPPQNFVTV